MHVAGPTYGGAEANGKWQMPEVEVALANSWRQAMQLPQPAARAQV